MNDPNPTVEPGPEEAQPDLANTASPERIGRYRIERVLGKGGFGLVYLASDEQLSRLVAIKVAHASLMAQAGDADAYLTEARTVANLDHSHIVPVYDVGSTEHFPCYVVSKYIDGIDLAARLQQSRLSLHEAVELTATVAEALHHAHKHGLVHRDIKPGNILLDKSEKPFVADFGLALREKDVGKGPRFAGTPAYMSPEQARGEGHRVDGRSDIFSLGVVLYELLTGRRPFKADSQDELLEQIATHEARPPRQSDDRIPKELERICLKALSKRASERYTTAKDMADDLRHWSNQDLSRRPQEIEPGQPVRQVVEAKLPEALRLKKAVFLSYASADKEAAFNLCRVLESQEISCWIAPRDVTPGADYGQAIIQAIETASVTLLLLSAHANASIDVTHEVERATSKRKRVIPVRLEDVRPGPSLELHLTTAQWVDAWRLSPEQVAAQVALGLRREGSPPVTPASPASTPPITPSSDRQPIKIVPKGLRSFDATDADFFLDLLPGPRDRDGLPEGIRFWKARIEETEADNTFSVGLIYGPSGCGKSSLVKAGLLPRLAKSVMAVYVEATGEETEARLLKGLRRQVTGLPGNLGLVESLAALRQGRFLASGQKVLLVLDQFEQWLHAKRTEANTELVQALRQCDGGRVQCIVMVRDDFWLAVSRFMKAMEVEILEGRNSALVDLFDLLHARKVLAAFGRAYGRLPDNLGQFSKEQNAFLDQAVSGLAQDGKVISVRLALFAEMVKGKTWTPATLKEVGGTEGVGVTFLEETFAVSTAPPQHRLHQKAAQAVLKALLPESGTDIKGHMRSQQDLLAAAGYDKRPRDFDELLRILDGELRLITPTDPEGVDGESASSRSAAEKYYQLTHDYLVPSLRDWLTRKQKETRRGRAELLLADRAVVWNARPENRQLFSLWQWMQIRWLTRKKTWTPPQRKMMRKAGRFHAVRGLAIAVVLALLGWGGYDVHGRVQAHALRERLLVANTTDVPTIVQAMTPYRRWLDPLLHDAYAQAEDNEVPRKQLHVSLALLPVDETQVKYLYDRLLDAEPHEVPVLVDALAQHKDELVEMLWSVAEKPEERKEKQRLRAAAALAKYDPDSERWENVQEAVANAVVAVPALHLGAWLESLRPVREKLLTPLAVIFRESKRRDAERSLATDILADYAADQPQFLAGLLMDADEKQFAALYPKFKDQAERGLAFLQAEVDRKPPPDAKDDAREKLAKRQANAAAALLKMNQPEKVWPLLKRGDKPDDPRLRSYLIHRFGPLGADAGTIVKRLDEEPDVTIRRALILSLGPEEFGEQAWKPEEKERVVKQLQKMYSTAADPGLQAAAEWLLRQWHKEAWLAQTGEAWAKDREQREKRLEDVRDTLQKEKAKARPQWYVNSQGQKMVVLPGPLEFMMGSPLTEVGRFESENQHKKRINRTFAIAAKAVTVAEYRLFNKSYTFTERYAPTPDCPVVSTSWYQAAAYCNWLSDQEGLAKCYTMDAKGQVTKLKENYLSLAGYRLPTEAEMEYATRAGAVTSRYYGETEELLGKYAWYQANSKERTWPVASKKPNDLGLFDMQGNVFVWCQERYLGYPKAKESEAIEDNEDILDINSKDSRVLRGGSFAYRPSVVRSAYRIDSVPANSNYGYGFRAARTFSP